MSDHYTVSLQKVIDSHGLETIYMPKDANEILIETNEVNRPGIVLTGYLDYFDPKGYRYSVGRNSAFCRI